MCWGCLVESGAASVEISRRIRMTAFVPNHMGMADMRGRHGSSPYSPLDREPTQHLLDRDCPSMDDMEEMPRNGPAQIAGPAWKQLQLYR